MDSQIGRGFRDDASQGFDGGRMEAAAGGHRQREAQREEPPRGHAQLSRGAPVGEIAALSVSDVVDGEGRVRRSWRPGGEVEPDYPAITGIHCLTPVN